MNGLGELQKKIRVTFRDLALLETAMAHSSFTNENPGAARDSNERLEFLGDAVLGFIVADRLYHDFPRLSEGMMTRLRAALVRRDTLARAASKIGLGDYLFLGKGEESSGGRHKSTNLACALEALIAAIFLDRGTAAAGKFIWRVLKDELDRIEDRNIITDYKSMLQELTQSRRQAVPSYRLVEMTGPDHDRRFTVEVVADSRVLGKGTGKNKKQAEMEAARTALQQLGSIFT